jgi:hypothetical protein
MLGSVITHLRQKVISLKDHLVAKASTLLSHLRVIGVSVMNRTIQFAINLIKHFVLILWNIAQKCVPSIMKVAYRRAEHIVVQPNLGETGLTVVVCAFLYPLRVLSLLLHKLVHVIKDLMEK